MQSAPQIGQVFIRSGFEPFAARAYLFDIDGTLLNTRDGVHWNAFRSALRQVFGIESLLDTVPVHGNTDIGILRAVTEQHGVPRSDFERKLAQALEIMRAEVANTCNAMRCELCPGIPELLIELRRRGKLLGVVSGNLESIGWSKITAAGLRELFQFGSFSDESEQRVEIFRHGFLRARALMNESCSTQQWAPGAEHCIFVGDTPADIAAARALGAPVMAVSTGIYSFSELLASSPDACVPCCSDLLRRG
ncbi:MAG: HAD family hydrolase [Acidobacteriales bacterium]|nr:HAD family hydrolase [Terriglobales bacterium]